MSKNFETLIICVKYIFNDLYCQILNLPLDSNMFAKPYLSAIVLSAFSNLVNEV